MELARQIGQQDRTQFVGAHSDSVLCQALLPATTDEIHAALAYDPCWAMLNPGMTLEAHQHLNPEFYVFVSGGCDAPWR